MKATKKGSNPSTRKSDGIEEEHELGPVQKRILVVDDDPSVREMLARVLASEGYLPVTAGDGVKALEIAAAMPIDLVLLDLNLPQKSGWDTFERLSSDNPLLPVIIVTARSNQLFTAMGAGVGALLEKPLDFPGLLRTIQELLVEPVEQRLSRVAGKSERFHYQASNSEKNPK